MYAAIVFLLLIKTINLNFTNAKFSIIKKVTLYINITPLYINTSQLLLNIYYYFSQILKME